MKKNILLVGLTFVAIALAGCINQNGVVVSTAECGDLLSAAEVQSACSGFTNLPIKSSQEINESGQKVCAATYNEGFPPKIVSLIISDGGKKAYDKKKAEIIKEKRTVEETNEVGEESFRTEIRQIFFYKNSKLVNLVDMPNVVTGTTNTCSFDGLVALAKIVATRISNTR